MTLYILIVFIYILTNCYVIFSKKNRHMTVATIKPSIVIDRKRHFLLLLRKILLVFQILSNVKYFVK